MLQVQKSFLEDNHIAENSNILWTFLYDRVIWYDMIEMLLVDIFLL